MKRGIKSDKRGPR
jgi:hypothetical protein